jgi:hypothetical protein
MTCTFATVATVLGLSFTPVAGSTVDVPAALAHY